MAIGGFSSFLGLGTRLYTYSPQDVTVVMDGHQVVGFVDGTFLTIELPQEEQFKIRRAADGTTHRSYHPITGVYLRLVLAQSSPSNDFLDGMLKSDTSSLQSFFSIMLKDANGSSSLQANECFVAKAPNMTFGTSIEEREWLVYCSDISVYTIGGNEPEQGVLSVFNDVVNSIRSFGGLFK